MRVSVDEARQKRVVRAVVACTRRIATLGFANGSDVDDAPGVDGEREAFLSDDLRLDA
jgi:hypothetical protein